MYYIFLQVCSVGKIYGPNWTDMPGVSTVARLISA
ncbi:hypothetical protein SAMN05421748_1011064 [Paractinoplanes atraurantiacus]|uniref:Uncharacterized protein n=1 Tax=Paractinoplanes atraurantiacus TaxID=1036182 RepID=A0A285FPU1_9ACTN|nr:hypothetical protein SAMN05421748_1011064 [Actinoplanes atraurantiacus]